MSDEVTQQAAELSAQKEDTKTAHVVGQQLLGHVIQERDDWRAEATRLNDAGTGLIIQLNVALADVERLTEERDAAQAEVLRLTKERDAAEREKQLTWENLQRMIRKCDAVILERDVSRDENYRIREERNNLHKENEGLRADALAYPPQRLEFTQYADLKADYDRQLIMIETLQEALKRTETLLAKAQAEHIDERLKGFLSVISQLADQAQDLLP